MAGRFVVIEKAAAQVSQLVRLSAQEKQPTETGEQKKCWDEHEELVSHPDLPSSPYYDHCINN
jgi:hypothetical protein